MPRYANDLSPSGPVDEALARVAEYLADQGFRRTDGAIWQKGSGWLVSPQFVSAEARGDGVHLEAWLRYAVLPGVYIGEMGITGAFGALPKRRLRGRVEAIEKLITGARPRAGRS